MRLVIALSLALMALGSSNAYTTESTLWEKTYLKNKQEDVCRSLKNPKDNFKLIRLGMIEIGMSECAMLLAAKAPGSVIQSINDPKKGTTMIWYFPVCAFGRYDNHLGVNCYNSTKVYVTNQIVEGIHHEDEPPPITPNE